MSDSGIYADGLALKFSYVNTFFHQEPFLNVAEPPDNYARKFDFIVASDVFEHVAPPVAKAFKGLRRMLKPGGVVIFTVPYGMQADTVEHYPDLWEYTVKKMDNKAVVENTTADGVVQRYENPVFHGGDGATLEMRLFSEASLRREFSVAGFDYFVVHGQPFFEEGIFWNGPCSITISAR